MKNIFNLVATGISNLQEIDASFVQYRGFKFHRLQNYLTWASPLRSTDSYR